MANHYGIERKESVLKKLLPPNNRSVVEVSKEEGIKESTLYNWLSKAKQEGRVVLGGAKTTSDKWSNQAKLSVLIETGAMTANEVSAYCRNKGLYPEQLVQWKQDFIESSPKPTLEERQALKQANDQIKGLEKELNRKEKALAEAAALLILQKKFQALLEGEGK
jgi:transposase